MKQSGFHLICDDKVIDVWCPETSYDTWIAVDEQGNEFITGNSCSKPNFQQLNNSSPIRQCFITDDGYDMIDTDLSSAELVMQGNALYPYDNGKFGHIIATGEKSKGTDFHSLNAKALKVGRGASKQIFYGISYGMGNILLGHTMWDSEAKDKVLAYFSDEDIAIEKRKLEKRVEVIEGKEYYPIRDDYKIPMNKDLVYMSLYGLLLKTNIQKNIDGLKRLREQLELEVRETKGYIYSLDKRLIYAKDTSSKLNYLLQSSNAVYTKYWEYMTIQLAFSKGLKIPSDFLPLGIIHDQLVFQVAKDKTKLFNKLVDKALVLINNYFKLPYGIECDTEVVKNLTGH